MPLSLSELFVEYYYCNNKLRIAIKDTLTSYSINEDSCCHLCGNIDDTVF